jgi:hypothetical protein
MEQLLRKAATQRILPGYTNKLLDAEGEKQTDVSKSRAPTPSASQPLIEPLSQCACVNRGQAATALIYQHPR